MNRWLVRQGTRLVGPPPPAGASKLERLQFVRRFYVRMLPIYVPLVVVLLALSGLPGWSRVVVAPAAVVWLQGFFSVGRRIRRERGPLPRD